MDKMIEVTGLKKKFGTLMAVDNVNFSVERGELFGFLGINGAGKSTTINMLSTIYKPTEGTIKICGFDVMTQPNEVRKKIGVVSQNNCLDTKLTVRENLITRGGLYESNKKILNDKIKEVSSILELNDLLDRKYEKLSGGQKRKCEVAKALLNTPELLFLDEPTTGLDPATRKALWSSLTKLRKETGMTIFLTTHYMEEAAKATHIAVIDKGKILDYGTPFELKEKYAKDKLFLVPKDMNEVAECLTKRNLEFKLKDNKISLTVNETMEALPIIQELSDKITGFEVIQGSMDDVFLNVTGKTQDDQREETK